MISFDSFYTELISDQRWKELLRHYKDDTIRKATERVWAQLVADKIEDVRPMSENRKHVYNMLMKNPGDKVVLKNWAAKALEIQEAEKEKDWKPADPAHVDKCVKEFFDMLKDAPMMARPPKEKVFYNGKPLEKLPPHPITSPQEAYEKDRHIEYLRHSYHPLTREKLPGWMPEKEFNDLYDQGLI